MKIPTVALYDNLRFTTTGQVWADFLLTGVNYGLRAPDEKERVRLLHQALLRSLPGESLMLGLCSTLDPHQVVDRMLNGLDPTLCPEWVAECEATLHTIEQLRPGYRIFWLSVPLANDGTTLSTAWKAARSNIEATLGLPVVKPSLEQLKAAGMKARQVAESIPAPFHPTPATPATIPPTNHVTRFIMLRLPWLVPRSRRGERPVGRCEVPCRAACAPHAWCPWRTRRS